ncbi:MAG: signal peptidase II [Clostridia bacterium]|nr:signal peptidase II [Clostridia bacterium]MDE7328317.1 signal peptidase II [Clostridia bacterium]
MINNENKKIILKRLIIEFILFALLLLSDLLSKDIVMNRLGLSSNTQYKLIDGVFAIYPCFNDGASFSSFSGKTGFLIALTAIITAALIALAIFNLIRKPKSSLLFRWALILIIAGGLGNLYDRLFCGGTVRDFIQYVFLDDLFEKFFHSSFGIGNIADIYLVLGVFLMCGYIIFDYKEGDLGIIKPKSNNKDGENSTNDDMQDKEPSYNESDLSEKGESISKEADEPKKQMEEGSSGSSKDGV